MSKSSKLKNFTRVSNRILDAMRHCELTGREKDVIIFVLRNTYGVFDKNTKDSLKANRISAADVAKDLGIHRAGAGRYLRALTERCILVQYETSQGTRPPLYGVEKNIEKWVVKRPASVAKYSYTSEKIVTPWTATLEDTGRLHYETLDGYTSGEQTYTVTVFEPPVERVERVDIYNKKALAKTTEHPLCPEDLLGRLRALCRRIDLPYDAIRALASWQKLPHPPQILAAWFREALDHVEQRVHEGATFRKPWAIVFDEAEKFRQRDKHDRYGYPIGAHKSLGRIYRNASGATVLWTGLPFPWQDTG